MAYIDKYGVEFSDDRKTLVCCSKDFQGEYVIPEGVTNIEGKAFYNCSNLISIKIPNSVTCIGKEAFWGCDCLTDIVFGNSVTRIEKHAFSYCRSLTSIEFPSSVTSIEDYAFSNCSSLTSIRIPKSVSSIGERIFSGCRNITTIVWDAKNCAVFPQEPFYNLNSNITSFTIDEDVRRIPGYLCLRMSKLTSLIIPNSVTSIGNSAFSDCSSLTNVEIPSSVISIENFAFSNCSSLTSISVAADNSTYSSEGGVLFNKDKTILIQYPGGKQGAYTIPNSVTYIGLGAFSGCGSLTTIEIPGSVTSIGNYAFVNCRNLKEVCVPKGQKARFAQMEGLKDYVDIIVECEHIV